MNLWLDFQIQNRPHRDINIRSASADLPPPFCGCHVRVGLLPGHPRLVGQLVHGQVGENMRRHLDGEAALGTNGVAARGKEFNGRMIVPLS